MLVLSFILFIFVNLFRWAELADNTTVRTFKDYIEYSERVVLKFSICWALITFCVWAFFNLMTKA